MKESATPSSPDDVLGWKGTDRYEIRSCLGRGGMGVVYEAFDRERRHPVALKTMLHSDPTSLYLFKQEFRTLADVHHANLVRLHEFVAEANRVFFTMELVRGVDFMQHVQVPEPPQSTERLVAETRRLPLRGSKPAPSQDEETGGTPAGIRGRSPAIVERLRPALRQLVEGVHALHLAGKLHRDIKPSNVLVTAEGRVVLLDFGVAAELSTLTRERRQPGEMVGTATYMAPEQIDEAPPTAASDWYSVGVMLFKALVGELPFRGSALCVMELKCTVDPPLASSMVEGVPPDLDDLCRALLDQDPDRRPRGDEILRRLGMRRSQAPRVGATAAAGGDTLFIGRESQLMELGNAFDTARSGQPITVRIAGASGHGKSALAAHFIDELVDRGVALALRGRAYERELVPYKAVDGVIDALSRHLKSLEGNDEQVTLPRDVWALAYLFPVLRRVEAVAAVAATDAMLDPQRMRQRAFAALRELLSELSRTQPVVVYVDDVQWGDVDSAALLLEVMRPPQAPPLLLVMTYRDAEAAASPFLTEMGMRWPADAAMRDVTVGPLDPDDARRLALALMASSGPAAKAMADTIARESGGSAFLVRELASDADARAEGAPAAPVVFALDHMIDRRLARLDKSTRRALELLALAGRPVRTSLLAEASSANDRIDEAVAQLLAQRFVRTGVRDGHEVVEPSHDRIRETIVARLPQEIVRKHHARIARALEATQGDDAEALAVHLLGSGETARAATYAERAAEQAASKLAFDQAVRLFKLTIECVPPASADATRLCARLGVVLEWAGRSAEAARVYLEAAKGASTSARLDFERAAAAHFLAAGHIDEGIALLRGALAAVGLRAPRSALSAVFWFLFYRLLLTIRGLRYVRRDPDEVAPRDRARIEALRAASTGLALIDRVVSASLQARHLLLALRRGDPAQVQQAAVFETLHVSGMGGPEGSRERALVELARKIVDETGDAGEATILEGYRGVRCFMRGQWKRASEILDFAHGNMPYHRAGFHTNAQLFAGDSLVYMGRIAEVTRRLPQMVAEAQEHGNLYTLVNLRAGLPSVFSLLAADEPETARRYVGEAVAGWSYPGFALQHWRAMAREVEIDLYCGRGVAGHARLARDARALGRSMLLRAQYVRAATDYLRARCAIATLHDGDESHRAKRLEEARKMRRRLGHEGMAWTAVLESAVAASVADAEADKGEAREHLRATIERAEAADMMLHVHVARFRLGGLVGRDEARALTARAEEAMRAEGIRVPERFAGLLIPGRWERRS